MTLTEWYICEYNNFVDSLEKNFNIYETYVDMNSYDIYCESDDDSRLKKITDGFVSNINKIIKLFKDFMENIIRKVEQRTGKKEFKDKLKEVKVAASNGVKVEFVDVWAYQDVLSKSVRAIRILFSKWFDKYNKKGRTVFQANHFLKKYEALTTKCEQQLVKIKNTKKQVDAQKALDWCEKNINKNGDAIGFLKYYQKELEYYSDEANKIYFKKEAFKAETGWEDGPLSFSKAINNATIYVKRNSDWIILYALSSISSISSIILKHKSINYIKSDPLLQGDDSAKSKYAQRLYRKKSYTDNYKKASKIASKISTGFDVAGTAVEIKSKGERRMSI